MTISDIVQLVREIQSLLNSRNQPSEEELVDLANRHEDLVEEVRTRLEKVERLLSQGLRTEAIELAELDPNLNDVLTALDFPEVGPWNELLESHEIQPVQPIPVEAAAELNDAYLASGSIEKLLQHYRTISLARAPLSKRVAALRQLALKDDQNPIWSQDLAEFEKHRVKEMKNDLDVAVKEEDLAVVAAIDQELSGSTWTIEVPAAIRQQARKIHEAMRKKSAFAELKTLSHQLSDAYADFDRPTAKRLQQRFLAVQGIAGVPSNHPLMDIAGPALDWLTDEATREAAESEHNSAVAEIESALDRKTSVEELERLYHRATRHGHTLSAVLQSRLAERRDQLISHGRRKRILIISLSTAACLMAVAAVAFLVHSASFNKAVAGHDQQLATLLKQANETGQLTPIEDYLKTIESQSAPMMGTPALLGRKQEYENLVASENGRIDQCNQLIVKIQNVIEAGSGLSEFLPAFEAFEQLVKQSKGEQEKARFLQLEQSLIDRRNDVQSKIDTAFNQEVKGLADTIEALPHDNVAGYDAVTAALNELSTRIEVSAPVKDSVNALQSKVQQDRQMVASNLKMAAGLQRITDSVGQLVVFEKNLTQFIRDNPGSERSTQFEKIVKEESAIWKGADNWHRVRRKLTTLELKRIGPAEAATLVSECDALQKDSGPFGDQLLEAKLVAALRLIASRSSDGNMSLPEQILAVLSRKTISRAYMIETSKGIKYYTKEAPDFSKGSAQADYFTTTTGTQTANKNFPAPSVPASSANRTNEDWLSPQTKMYQRIEAKRKTFTADEYDTAIATIVKDVVESDSVDPLLKVLLIEELLKLGSGGSEAIRGRSEKILNTIGSLGVSRLTNWAAPEDARADDERTEAKAFLSGNGESLVADLAKAAADTEAIESSSLPPDIQCVGWMHKNPRSEWIVSLKTDLVFSGKHSKLCVFYLPAKTPTVVTLAYVGILQRDSKLSVPATLVEDSPVEGRPVYLLLEDASL